MHILPGSTTFALQLRCRSLRIPVCYSLNGSALSECAAFGESWISERVLKLTRTAEDMLPLAEACDFTGASFREEYSGRLNKWDEAERAHLMAELDAAYFHLYGIVRDDAEYILSTFKGIHDPNDLLPARRTTAEHVLAVYEELGN